MGYKESHELPYQSGLKEKFLSLGPISLSLGETGWVALGVFLTSKMVQYVPPIPYVPIPGNSLHYLIPLVTTYFFSKAKHPATGLPLWQYFARWVTIRQRQREYYYRKVNTVKGGDRHL